MEYAVVYPGPAGTEHLRRVESLDEAGRLVEQLRNADGLEQVSVHALREVPLSFRPYYHAELVDPVAVTPPPPQPAPPAPVLVAVPSPAPVVAPDWSEDRDLSAQLAAMADPGPTEPPAAFGDVPASPFVAASPAPAQRDHSDPARSMGLFA